MKLQTVISLANKVVESGVQDSYIMTDIDEENTNKVIKSIFKNIETLTEEEKEALELIICVKAENNLTKMRTIMRDELGSLKKDVKEIKRVVGCNGDA